MPGWLLRRIALDPLEMGGHIVVIIGLPFVLGVLCAEKLPALTQRIRKPARILSFLCLIAFIVGAVAGNWRYFLDYVDVEDEECEEEEEEEEEEKPKKKAAPKPAAKPAAKPEAKPASAPAVAGAKPPVATPPAAGGPKPPVATPPAAGGPKPPVATPAGQPSFSK